MVMFCTESRPVNTQTSEVSGGRYGGIASSSWVPIPLPCRSGPTARRPNVALVPSTSTRIDPTSRWPSQAPRVTTLVRSRSARSSSMVWVSGGMLGSSYTCASLTQTMDELRADLDRTDVVTLGAWLGHRLVGSIRVEVDGTKATLGRLAVVPD